MKVLITGIDGFIGQALAASLLRQGSEIRGTVRQVSERISTLAAGIEIFAFGDIDERTIWKESLDGIDVVVHLAARVHLLNDQVEDPLFIYRRTNFSATKSLALQALAAGVRRFVYVSSVKVNGEESFHKEQSAEGAGALFSEKDTFVPTDPYALSKWEAEKALRELSQTTDMEVVIVRPPLVYGPGVKANFLRILQLVGKGIPLPFYSVKNRRSMIYVENLVHFLSLCLVHPKAAGETFLISDGEDLSTPELLRRLNHALSRTPCLFFCPSWILRAAASLMGREQEMNRLIGSLCVDISKGKRLLNWQPPYSVSQGLQATGRWYLNHTLEDKEAS